MRDLEMPASPAVQHRVSAYGWPKRRAKAKHARHRRRILTRRAARLATTTGATR